jgi:hypothetical protein
MGDCIDARRGFCDWDLGSVLISAFGFEFLQDQKE